MLHYAVCDVDNLFSYILAYQCKSTQNLTCILQKIPIMACYKNITKIFVYDLQTLFENMAHNAVYQILTGYRYSICNIKTLLSDIGTNIFSCQLITRIVYTCSLDHNKRLIIIIDVLLS